MPEPYVCRVPRYIQCQARQSRVMYRVDEESRASIVMLACMHACIEKDVHINHLVACRYLPL